jgi:hypothetical protein
MCLFLTIKPPPGNERKFKGSGGKTPEGGPRLRDGTDGFLTAGLKLNLSFYARSTLVP